MRRVPLDCLEPGMKLALPIRCRHSYKVLLNAGIEITEKQIEIIKRLSPGIVYVFTPDFAGHPGQEIYNEAVTTMDNIFQNVFAGESVEMPEVKKVVNGIVEQVNSRDQILVQLARLNDADSYSVTHCVNVCIYSVFIGNLLSLSPRNLNTLGLGALLHDIGKLHVPEKLLHKAEKLTEDEFSIIKKHPLTGYNHLDDGESEEDVRVIVRDHHEKCDGSGYPYGITGEKITFLTKIVTVADIYDAVSSDRAYRPKMLPHEGMEILIANCSAGKIDRKVVDAFTRKVDAYPPGCLVRLNTGELARVAEGSSVSWRPKVAVQGNTSCHVIDLAKNPTIFITEMLPN